MVDLAQYRIAGDTAGELAASIEDAIARGDLPPGDALPPVRWIARELGLSPTTVTSALARLRSRGLVVSRERSRSYVSWRPPVGGAWPLAQAPEGARDLATGNPDPKLLPRLGPALRRLPAVRPLYGAEPGLPELLRLASREFDAAGIPGDHIAVVSGALDGIERTLAAHLRPGDSVAVEDPGYPGVIDLCRALGLGIVPVAVDGRGMVPDALAATLAKGVSAVVLTPRGQNPTGATLDASRARALRKTLARDQDALVIEDDHLGPVAGAPRISLADGRRRWAAARSVSKSLGPDLRLALLAGDGLTIERVGGRQLLGPQWVSHLLQQLVVELWTDQRVSERLAEAGERYRERRQRFVQHLAAEGLDVEAPAGLNVWIPVADEASTVRQLLERGWAVAAGAPFRLRCGPAIRVTTSTLRSRESLRLARDVAQAIRPIRRTRAA